MTCGDTISTRMHGRGYRDQLLLMVHLVLALKVLKVPLLFQVPEWVILWSFQRRQDLCMFSQDVGICLLRLVVSLWQYSDMNTIKKDVANDLWRYNLLTNQWTWLSGESTSTAQSRSFVGLGVEVATNNPGSRLGHSMVSHNTTNTLLFFGGSAGNKFTRKFRIHCPSIWQFC